MVLTRLLVLKLVLTRFVVVILVLTKLLVLILVLTRFVVVKLVSDRLLLLILLTIILLVISVPILALSVAIELAVTHPSLLIHNLGPPLALPGVYIEVTSFEPSHVTSINAVLKYPGTLIKLYP